LAQFVTAGDAKEDPVPAIPAAVINGRRGAAGGVADAGEDVVVVDVDVVDVVVVVEVAAMSEEVAPPASEAPARTPIRTRTSNEAPRTGRVAVHLRSRADRAKILGELDVMMAPTGTGPRTVAVHGASTIGD
jgi:hypothetical protein